MRLEKIETVRDFCDVVVDPDFNEFEAHPIDLRRAFHACTSLLSLRDWICDVYADTSWQAFGNTQTPFTSKKSLQESINNLSSSANIVADISNASKHRVLMKGHSYTPLYGTANVVVQMTESTISSSPISSTPIAGSSSRIVVEIGGAYYDVIGCVRDLHSLWHLLMSENHW